METTDITKITVETAIKAPVEKAWRNWIDPGHIVRWYFASSDWHAPFAENDFRVGGKFITTMAAKDGSMEFDFEGVYTKIVKHKTIAFTIRDGRKVTVEFSVDGNETRVTEVFDPENIHTLEMQRNGWQSILDNFKMYTESGR